MTNVIDAINNVVNALRETGPAHVDADLYHAVMDMPGFSEEALIVAFSHLLDNTTGFFGLGLSLSRTTTCNSPRAFLALV